MFNRGLCCFPGISHGHTGHVRFLTAVELPPQATISPLNTTTSSQPSQSFDSYHITSKTLSHLTKKGNIDQSTGETCSTTTTTTTSTTESPLSPSSSSSPSSKGPKVLVISGGDGHEDFGNFGHSDLVGRDDSTNHLLLWQLNC